MDIVYNHNSTSFLLLENNTQIPLEQVITQCINEQDLNYLHKVMGMITDKYVVHLNMIQKLLETNNSAENENDDLCQNNSEQYQIIQTSNEKIAQLEQQLQDCHNDTNDKHHKLWVQLLKEKKQNERNNNLVEEMKQDNLQLSLENIRQKDQIEKLHQYINCLQMEIDDDTNTNQIQNLENQLHQEKNTNNKIHQLVDELEKKNNKLWNELVYQKNNQETATETATDYDMLSDVSYTN